MSCILRIGILGTRGIPNRYGGFEQCAEYLAAGLVKKGHEVFVYNSHNHEYQQDEWDGAHIIHCNDPEHKIGTVGQFVYDFNCIRDARKRKFDIVLQLGYTSSSVWHWYWPGKAKNIVNMDGLEWKRSKYSKKVQWFLKHAEKWAAQHGDLLIADSLGIQQRLQNVFGKSAVYIPYGAEPFSEPDEKTLMQYSLTPFGYKLLIARMEPENNIETIIRASLAAKDNAPLVIVSKADNKFGQYLRSNYEQPGKIIFAGDVYDKRSVNDLRYYSRLYFHGHSVGGTNPSLLEAMACNALIVAHDNVFNKTILGNDAFYFSDEQQLAVIIDKIRGKDQYTTFLENNRNKIDTQYNWPNIVALYEKAMLEAVL